MENNKPLDKEVLRSLVFECLKEGGVSQIVHIDQGVENLAVQRGYIQKPEGYYSGGFMNKHDQMIVQEIVWELIIQGILTPGSDSANRELPFIRLTDYGQRCVAEQQVLPHDYG